MHSVLFSLIFCLLLLPAKGQSEDLLATYHLAQVHDPTIQAAKSAQLAAQEAYPQARSLFLPVIAATSSNTTYNKVYTASSLHVSNLTLPLTSTHYSYIQSVYALTINQPIFYYDQWVQFAKADKQVKQANAIYAAAEQDLIVRTMQRYFSVLKAKDMLHFAETQLKANMDVLAQAEGRFKAGVLNIKDLQIARARKDNAVAQKIAAENVLRVQETLLKEITCVKIEKYASLQDKIQFTPPEPENLEQWLCKAFDLNLNLLSARYQMEASKQNVKINKGDFLPTVNINGAVVRSSATNDLFALPKNTNSYIGLQFAVPIFNGGASISKTRQAKYLYDQSFQQMEVVQRQVESNTTQFYQGVLTQVSQIAALKTAVESNQTSYESALAFFTAGTGTIVDAVNALSDHTQTQQAYASARYDYILQSIQLKQAAGILCPEDVERINAWLK
jgi:outer membrane protein